MSPPLLEVSGLRKDFPLARTGWFGPRPQRIAVDGVDFTMQAGRSFGVVGKSGSGKSTLARLVMALTMPTAGEVRLLGRSLFALSRAELKAARADIPDGVPGPLWLARSAHDRRAHRRGAAAARPCRGRKRTSAWRRVSPRSGSTPARRGAIRTNSPAASASASPSPARW